MTDKQQILAYLAQVQRMQLEEKEVAIGVDFNYKTLSVTATINLQEDFNRFFFWHEYSEEENKREMERFINDYNKYEHDRNNHRTHND